MKEEEKEEFLSLFKEGGEKTHLGLAVLGGHFSEGIGRRTAPAHTAGRRRSPPPPAPAFP